MGHFCHLNKKSPRAVYFAHKACLLDTRNVEALLLKGNVLLDLKKLPDAMNHFREAPQPWVAMGHFCHLNKKSPRAVYFAHKACLLDTRNVEALLLKGNVLLDLKKLP